MTAYYTQDSHNFTYETQAWYPIAGCSGGAYTQMSYDWTIPQDLNLTNSEFTQCSITFTNLTYDEYSNQAQSFDSNLFYIKAATATTSSAGPTTTISTTTPTPSPEPSLSTGAKAGIGVGVACVVLCCVLGAWFSIKRRRRKTTVGSERPVEEQISGYVKAEMDANETRQRAELDAGESGTHVAQKCDTLHKASEREPVELMG
ncbi:hypothetical protein BDP55DRAFT_659982 [Colletotrichum godetiae]|uniref:Uncharacterized protein n=1 Tax=Colletotrichum godetiae TaxID=1209918 RepID=A0AAJ0EUA5_9PEZI|nr:uncharacterized protein BDP55DRAFT_659982 [Colletotrichum godetiae]KAK1687399.1 hypothetical protein BDP55DRAFT_659982 [Colletotrichum godetiae]